MAVTIYPPLTANAEPVVEARGVAWTIGGMGSLDIIDAGRVIVATFSSGAWGRVEQS